MTAVSRKALSLWVVLYVFTLHVIYIYIYEIYRKKFQEKRAANCGKLILGMGIEIKKKFHLNKSILGVLFYIRVWTAI